MERHVLINKLHLNISANLTHPFSPKICIDNIYE